MVGWDRGVGWNGWAAGLAEWRMHLSVADCVYICISGLACGGFTHRPSQ